MKGLEPSTFCMANASDRSLLFASVRQTGCLQRFPCERANKTEPERTPNLAILATDSGAEAGLGEFLRDRSAVRENSIGRRPVTPEVAGSSPVAPVFRACMRASVWLGTRRALESWRPGRVARTMAMWVS
jgi:hypothetical protein